MSGPERGLDALFAKWPTGRPVDYTFVDERTLATRHVQLPEGCDLASLKLQVLIMFA